MRILQSRQIPKTRHNWMFFKIKPFGYVPDGFFVIPIEGDAILVNKNGPRHLQLG